ncbi:NAD(P)-dependent dehydrogenase (short-subunit alcohol dehydrogenase family) [Bacillus sp. SORGH_AS 510]|uniref:SDR family NAD(P)-dependent oxidoreductase n=1 Tax=Bacillus sp. SORGH_AS_0510 TaxID=3041771 RepID=UPI00278A3A81|nr:SDR family NAD(P)-dependent oxidoreductase [Bacillus sp. SORGH_AS_0510]MDQ1147811.1 NAD(P)-dependent dehydrogenase (short-subunit alcohol dehydrogenase family) [Bacillus sp. SORGH_AS_0510]
MKEKVLLIVGAGPGISLSTAKRFGKEGFKIALVSRGIDALRKYEEELNKEGITAKGFPGDVSSEVSLKAAIDSVINTYGKIDVLLYNAAAGKPGKPTTLSMDDLVKDFKISVAGALTSVKEVTPYMEKGTLLLTGGGLALYPYADYASLAIGKAGIRNLAYSLHQELSSKGIYVGTLTIKGFVQEGTYYSAENIAETFYSMYETKEEVEVIFEEK